jgi:hypothetical protein
MRFTSLERWRAKSKVNMNNTKKQLSAAGTGTVPLIIILGLIIGAGYFLLQGDIKLTFLEDRKNVEVRRLNEYPVTVPLDSEIEKIHSIIKSEDELINFLASIDKTNALTVDEKIDFDKEYLIGVTSKALTKGGNEFRIKKVYIDKEKDELLVSSRLKKPSDNCVTTDELNIIVDIVAISKTDQEVKYETLIETFTCSDE